MGAVWVEAKQDRKGGGVVLSLKNVKARRLLKEKYGRHNVRTSVDRVRDFPTSKIGELRKGWPVQFKMDSREYLSLLGVGADVAEALGGLAGGMRHDTPPSQFAVAEAKTKGGKYEIQVFTNGEEDYWIEEFTNGNSSARSVGHNKDSAKKEFARRIKDARAIDRINYIITFNQLGGGLGGLELGRWKDYHSGDRIRITAPSKHFGGKPITVEGVVYNANNYGTDDDPNWKIEFDMFATEFAEAGPQKWEQKKHGGSVEMLQMAQDLSIPPPPNPQMSLPGVSGLFGDTGGFAALPPYRWIITKDYIDNGESKGMQGPRNADPSLKTNREHFVIKDADGETYYEGDIYGDYDGFEPLDDFGTPNAGASDIWYGGKPL